jgi:prepilin-type N-terminal cleavage/methylation domain-containing protein/prepilin-type processing-associated H-X9-DG protein
MSLIELVVAIAILGVLSALALSAVQQARSVARRIQCVNNLKQIGIALAHYEAEHHVFPPIDLISNYIGPNNYVSSNFYSPFVRMLPMLDQAVLHHAVNFLDSPIDPPAFPANLTVLRVSLGVALCPEDAGNGPAALGHANYRFNLGPTHRFSPGDMFPGSWDGPFTTHRVYRASDFRDGLSNTVAASERLQGDWLRDRHRPGGDYLLTDVGIGSIPDADAALAACRGYGGPITYESRGGESWFFSGLHFTLYNHVATPNDPASCSMDRVVDDLNHRVMHDGSFPATSRHPGGVHCLTFDGSVRFVKDAISLQVWRALSTRQGGEVVDGAFGG